MLCVTAQIQEFGNPGRLPNYENSKLKRRERKSRSAHNFGNTKAGGIEIHRLSRTPKTLLLAQYIITRILVFDQTFQKNSKSWCFGRLIREDPALFYTASTPRVSSLTVHPVINLRHSRKNATRFKSCLRKQFNIMAKPQ